MTGFTKLFSSILNSSIWNEDDKTRILWITMLAMADSNGFITGSPAGVAHQARLSLADCEKALLKLKSPDPQSKSKEYEGRRICAIDGGWIIINYLKYRNQEPSAKEYWRQQKERNKEKENTDTHTYTEGSKNVLGKRLLLNEKRRFTPPTLEEIEGYIKERNLSVDGRKFLDYFTVGNWIDSNGNKVKNWKQKLLTWSGRNERTRETGANPTPSPAAPRIR